MAYIIIGRKGKTIRYISNRPKKGKRLRRLPVAVSTKKEAEFIRDKKRKDAVGWKLRIKKI